MRRWTLLGVAVVVVLAMSLALDAGARSSVSPPRLESATIDSQRRLVVSFVAPDGVNYGGHVYLDNDPRNTQLSGDPAYGQFMYCNNKGTCLGRWPLPTTSSTGPQTFTTPVLDPQTFPPGTYAIEVSREAVNGLSFIGYRRTKTTIELPASSSAYLSRQLVEVEPADLEAALARDAEASNGNIQP